MNRVILGLSAGILSLAINPAFASEEPVVVMSRNLYLGSDVGVALEKIPNLPEAAQFMWNQVKKTNFAERKKILAKEIQSESPDVIGLQEATVWYCKANPWSKKVEVYNFTSELLQELDGKYVIAKKGGISALNPGYSIGPIPVLTKVRDPETFQRLFGQDSASCGFQIGDALIIKSELLQYVNRVGNSEYEDIYKVVPTLMEIQRGYTWMDIVLQGRNVRVVSTHLESLWDENEVPKAAIQAKQLVDDLKKTQSPIIVIGDFNSDPRDPRPSKSMNPGGQPTESQKCPAGSSLCSAYKVMREAGYEDAGPDSSEAISFTWGTNALLTGADNKRAEAAMEMGNQFGFTDRLDYIFLKNGLSVLTSRVIGTTPPYGSDHAGIVAEINLTRLNSIMSDELDSHQPFPITFWNWVGLAFLILILWRLTRRIKKRN